EAERRWLPLPAIDDRTRTDRHPGGPAGVVQPRPAVMTVLTARPGWSWSLRLARSGIPGSVTLPWPHRGRQADGSFSWRLCPFGQDAGPGSPCDCVVACLT